MATITTDNSETDQIVLDAIKQLSSETGESVESIWNNGYTDAMNAEEVLQYVRNYIGKSDEQVYWGGNPVF